MIARPTDDAAECGRVPYRVVSPSGVASESTMPVSIAVAIIRRTDAKLDGRSIRCGDILFASECFEIVEQ